MKVKGLIDTGASCTCLDPAILNSLEVAPTGTVPVHTPSTKSDSPHVASQFDVSIIFAHPLFTRTWRAVAVIESELAHGGIQALIGRDILQSCLLTYDGEAGTFTIGF
jgi:hypothetical protein